MAGKKKEDKKKWADMTPDEQLAELDEEITATKDRITRAKDKLKSLESKKNELIIERIKKKAEENNQTLDDLM